MSITYLISRTIAAILAPIPFIALIGLAGLVLMLTRYRALGRRLTVACAIALVVCGFTPFGNFLLMPLERQFPAWDPSGGPPDGMVVLGGGIDRVFATARLAKAYPNARIFFTGGNPTRIGEESYTESDLAEPLLLGLGVSADRLVFERNSLNTLENAILSKSLIAPKPGERWLLVTSAFHMPRAMGLFRTAGFAVEPHPVGGKMRGWRDVLTLDASFMGRVHQTSLGIHEWLGLIAYRVSGRTSELLPSPRPPGS